MSIDRLWEALERGAEPAIQEDPTYPERATFADAESPDAGIEIARSLGDGTDVLVVAADGHEHILRAAARLPERRPTEVGSAGLIAERAGGVARSRVAASAAPKASS